MPYAQSTARPTLAGVLYAEDFDCDIPAAAEADAPEAELIVPMFTAAEMDAARDLAHLAGRTECEHGLVAARVRLLGLIATALQDAAGSVAQIAEAHAQAVAPVILSALAACLPAMCAQHGATELRALAQAVLPGLTDAPRVAIRVNPAMLAAMQDEAALLDADLAERIVWLPAEAVAPGDARIAWQDGQAIRDAGKARDAMMDVLATLGLLQREDADA